MLIVAGTLLVNRNSCSASPPAAPMLVSTPPHHCWWRVCSIISSIQRQTQQFRRTHSFRLRALRRAIQTCCVRCFEEEREAGSRERRATADDGEVLVGSTNKVLSLPAAVEARRVACRLVAAVSWPASYHDNLFPPFRFLASDSLLSRNFLILGLGLLESYAARDIHKNQRPVWRIPPARSPRDHAQGPRVVRTGPRVVQNGRAWSKLALGPNWC